MSALEIDLARWEEGSLALEEVAARHPGAGVRELTDLHARLLALADEPVPAPEPGWEAVRSRLEAGAAGGVSPSSITRWVRRPMLVAAAAAVLLAGVAAATPAVRQEIGRIWRGITSIFGDDSPAPPPARRPGLRTDEPAAGVPPAVSGREDDDRGGAGEREGEGGDGGHDGRHEGDDDGSGDHGSGSDDSGSGDSESDHSGSGSDDSGSHDSDHSDSESDDSGSDADNSSSDDSSGGESSGRGESGGS